MVHERKWFAIFFVVTVSLAGCGGSSPDQETGNVPDAPVDENTGQANTSAGLRDAALNGQINRVREAVNQGTDLHEADALGRTALMFAAYNGHTNVVRFLIEEGADAEAVNDEGRTALMFAASGPFPETVELLLEKGVSPDRTDAVEGWSALMFAAAEGNSKVVRKLLDYGADVSLQDADGETAADFARNNGHMELVQLLDQNR